MFKILLNLFYVLLGYLILVSIVYAIYNVLASFIFWTNPVVIFTNNINFLLHHTLATRFSLVVSFAVFLFLFSDIIQEEFTNSEEE